VLPIKDRGNVFFLGDGEKAFLNANAATIYNKQKIIDLWNKSRFI